MTRVLAILLALVGSAPAEPTERPRDNTFELEGGVALLATSPGGLVGAAPQLDFGAGWFVSKRVALSLRGSAALLSDRRTTGVVGVLGPHVQLWLADWIWLGVGGGFGYGFANYCSDRCDTFAWRVWGYSARAGMKLDSDSITNVSLEWTQLSMNTGEPLYMLSLLLGHQWL